MFRQIRETVGWIVSEPMLVFYLKFLRDFFWPGGTLAEPTPPFDEERSKNTRVKAKSALIRNIPGKYSSYCLFKLFGSCQLGLRVTVKFEVTNLF